jgi:beta-glucosidase-like glycosyl hydrolase
MQASIPSAVNEGLVDEKDVRLSARRFLAKQIALGALEPTKWDNIPSSVVDSPGHRALALQAAQQSLVLLRNEPPAAADSTSSWQPNVLNEKPSFPMLPLSTAAKIALLGPHATSTKQLLGNYHGVNLQVLNASIVDVVSKRGLRFTQGAGVSSLTKRNATLLAEAVQASDSYLVSLDICS